MTIVIYNNSPDHNIYPVLFAGARSARDQWMQACFRITDKEVDDNPYPRHSQYRMYVNCCKTGENGIPPLGSVEITLPFYSPLVPTIDSTVQDPAQFIDWWQGGGINIYKAPSTSMPPPHLLSHWEEVQRPGPGRCAGQQSSHLLRARLSLHFFTAPASIPDWAFRQNKLLILMPDQLLSELCRTH